MAQKNILYFLDSCKTTMASSAAIKSEIKGEEGIGSGAEKLPNENQGTKKKVQMEFRTGDSSLNNNM